jgi:hypothetical protein
MATFCATVGLFVYLYIFCEMVFMSCSFSENGVFWGPEVVSIPGQWDRLTINGTYEYINNDLHIPTIE